MSDTMWMNDAPVGGVEGEAPAGDVWPTGDVAMLIDYENVQRGLRDGFGVDVPRADLLLDAARRFGRVVTAGAYADWVRPDLAAEAPLLLPQGIELVHVPGRKNSADIRITIDALDLVRRHDGIRTIVVVSGDGDLSHMVTALRRQGRRVVVIGVGGTFSATLAVVADRTLQYEHDLDPEVGLRDLSDTPDPTSGAYRGPLPELVAREGAPPIEDTFGMIADVLTRHGRDGWLNGPDLGNRLLSDHGVRPSAWYGVRLGILLAVAEREGVVRLHVRDGITYAGLPDAAVPAWLTSEPA
ncbi:MAG TPA: NYN domain-containing protein [Thermomicrobiales bacterium]|jgi:uncharacterized protein (TIGR00288 family)|nr:NYN domain-containing protein [Thermomicrobiales bacterium]